MYERTFSVKPRKSPKQRLHKKHIFRSNKPGYFCREFPHCCSSRHNQMRLSVDSGAVWITESRRWTALERHTAPHRDDVRSCREGEIPRDESQLVTANMLETCTISPTRVPYTSRVHSAPELKVEETRRSRSHGKSPEEFTVGRGRRWDARGGRVGGDQEGQGCSNRLVRVLPCTLTNS